MRLHRLKMTAMPISTLDAGDRPQAIATVVAAFADDPVERWLYPTDEEYERHFPDLAVAFAGPTFEGGTAWALDGHAAVALWLGPGTEADGDAIAAVFVESVAAEKHEELFAVLGQMGEAHPADPHWYLPWLAVVPDRQGGGLGGRLLAHCLAIVDASGLPAFLETPNPRNVGFYERHGFEVVAVTESPSCPPLTSMLRPGGGTRSSP
jgi:ribosomal protein S18 acetylase RimI-like enzyme